jgi:hypothetical protein
MKNIFTGFLVISFFQWACSPVSPEPDQGEPDLVIQEITYTAPPGPARCIIYCDLTIQNIGKADYHGFLYVSDASATYYLRYSEFSHISLVYCDWNGDSIKPGLIPKDSSILVQVGCDIPADTNVIVFYIQTNHRGIKDTSIAYPTSEESNYENNFYEHILKY